MARFGTDGVRGVAGVELTPALALALGSAAVTILADSSDTRPLVVVGRDPRPSGEMLQSAVVSGLLAAGADVVLLGVIPTPAVARAVADGLPGLTGLQGLTRLQGLPRLPDLGVVVSASHNPMPDNGIKLVGPGGTKLPDTVERRIEAALEAPPKHRPGLDVGRIVADLSADHQWYVDALLATVPHPLDGLRVVVDTANGAAAPIAAEVYRRAGADVVVINDDTSGERINDGCGATHMEALQAAVVSHGAAVGIAHDGDADRCLAVTAAGDVVDGDAILAVLAVAMRQAGTLHGNTIAATVMSNLGLSQGLSRHGISLVTTPVGDRHVCEAMRAGGLRLGGEQSGHIVLADHATTGDGLLTALHLLARMAATGRSLADLAAVVTPFPQVLLNVRVTDREAAMAALRPRAEQVTAELGAQGRVLVRPSGTEPLVRVMVEAPTEQRARALAEQIASAVPDLSA